MTAQREKKLRIIELAMRTEDEKLLTTVEEQLSRVQKPLFWEAIKPVRKGISFQQLLEEQNYQPLSYEAFSTLAMAV